MFREQQICIPVPQNSGWRDIDVSTVGGEIVQKFPGAPEGEHKDGNPGITSHRYRLARRRRGREPRETAGALDVFELKVVCRNPYSTPV